MLEMAKPRSFSRRSFIAGAAALTAAGALSGCSQRADDEEPVAPVGGQEEIFSGVCRGNCFGGCYLNVHVRDGQVVRTTAGEYPESEYKRICPKGLTHVSRIYSAKRIQYPMRRIGEKGSGEFERISWDEALAEICEKWKAITDEHGPSAMAVYLGSGNYGISGAAAVPVLGFFMNRFINTTGASQITSDLDASSSPSYHVAPGLGLGAGEPRGFSKAKTLIVWGANPAISQVQNMHFILEAKEQGTRYIVIDPAYNANAAKADWYVPINATTDGALALGVIGELMANDWIDKEFVRAHTNAAFLIKDDAMFLRMSDLGVEPAEGEESPYAVWDEASSAAVPYTEAVKPVIEGVAEVGGVKVRTAYDNLKEIVAGYPLDRTTEITGVPAEDITELARVYAQDGPVMTYREFGYDHYINAHYNHWPQMLVTILTGNCGNSGAGCGMSSVSFAYRNAGVALAVNAAGEPGLGSGPLYQYNQVENIIDTGMYGKDPAVLKGVYITCANILATQSGYEYPKRWLSKMELVVLVDMVMTETANYADYVLPAAHWFEVEDLYTCVGTAPYLVWQDKCIEPLYEARGDFDILKDIAAGLGYGEFIDVTLDEYVAGWLDTDGARGLGLTVESLREKKVVRFRDPFEDVVAQTDAAGPVFFTATGRAELYADVIAKGYDLGQEYPMEKERSPYWEPSPEIEPGCEQRAKFPFHMFSEHMRTHTHSQWWDCDYLKEFEAEPVVKISPEDAASKGIVAGDLVRIFNDRGYVVMKAVINAGLPKGMLGVPRAWDGPQFVEGHMNSLLRLDYIYAVANQAFNDVAVDIEKM